MEAAQEEQSSRQEMKAAGMSGSCLDIRKATWISETRAEEGLKCPRSYVWVMGRMAMCARVTANEMVRGNITLGKGSQVRDLSQTWGIHTFSSTVHAAD